MAESHREEIAKLEALYASNPGGRVFVHLAEAYRKAGEHDRARRILNEGLERHADSASAYVVLGRVLADAGEDNEAQTAFRRVLDLDSGNLVALRWLGDLARKSGRPSEARGYYRDLLARNPHNTEIQELLASVEGASDEPEPAESGGRTDQQSAEPEFGIVQLDDLPGDLGAFTGVAPPRDQSVEETTLEEALGIEIPSEEGEPESLELEHFEAQITEEPLDETMLESSLELESFGGGFEDELSDVPDFPVDLSDMNVKEEPEEEYMAGSFDLSGFEEPADEEEPDTQPIDTGGLNETAEFEAPTYADDLPTLYAPDEDTAPAWEEPRTDGPASLETSLEYAEVEEPEVFEFPGEGTEDAPAETLLEPIEPAQEPATFSAEPPTAPFMEEPVEAAAEPEPYEPEPYEPEPAWSATPEPETYSAEPEYVPPAEPSQPFLMTDPLQAASEQMEPEPITEEQWAETGAAEAVPLEGVESAFSDVVGGAAAEEDDGLVTETMAELYRAQGFADRAADVYRTLLRRRPGDARLAARLEELEGSLAVPQVESVFEEDESGEIWLRGVGTAWTGTLPPAIPERETPYTWTEAEEAQAGEPVGSFLRTLVQWRPTRTAGADQPESQPEPLLLDAQAEASTPQPWTPATPEPWSTPAAPASDPWSAAPPAAPAPREPEPWTPPPVASAPPDAWAQTPTPPTDPFGAPPSASATEPWAAPPTPPAADPRTMQQAPPAPAQDPWASPATPQAAEPWAQQPPAPPAASAAEPWAAPPPAPEPWAAQSEQPPAATGSGRSNSSPVEAAFDAWYSPAGETPAPTPPAPTPPPAPAAPPPAAEQEEPGADAEDEDLEMFRSWLQSLKK